MNPRTPRSLTCEKPVAHAQSHTRLAKGTSIYTLGTIASKLLQLAIQVLLARQLRISGYGLYSLGFSAIILLQSVALVGLDQAVLRYGAIYRSRGQSELVKGTLLASLAAGVVLSLVIAAALIAASSAVSTHAFGEPMLRQALRIFALSLPFYIITRITGAFAQSHHDILRMTAIQQISQPGLNLLLVAGLFFWNVGLQGAVAAFVVSTAFSAALGLYSIRAIFPEFYSSLKGNYHWRELLRFSLALAAIAVFYQLFWRAPNLLLGHLSGASAVGLYSAAATMTSPPGFLSLIFAQPFMPMMVDLYEQRKLDELNSLYGTVTRWTQMVVIPGFGFLVLFRKSILALFGPDFRSAGTILIAMGVAWMIYYAKGPIAAVLDMTGRQFIDLANLMGVLILSLGLGFWLIPRNGAKGAGFAISISVLAWTVAEMIEGWIIFRFPPLNIHFVQSMILASLVFGMGWLLEDHISTFSNVILVAGSYLSLFFLFGLTQTDRDLARRGIRKVAQSFARPIVFSAQD